MVVLLEYKVNGFFFVKLVYLQETIKLEYRERRIINVVSPLSSLAYINYQNSSTSNSSSKNL